VTRATLLTLMLGVAAVYVFLGARNQWDFETYYYAGAACRSGVSPYTLEGLSLVAGKTMVLPFLYPPITLALFVPLSHLPIHLAAGVWLAFKCLLLALLLWVWRREFLGSIAPELFLAVALFGFNLAVLWDLRTGNVALLEGAILWLAFSAYLRNRLVLAMCLIAIASIFKLLPILFLGLLLMAPRSTKVRLALVASGAVLLLGLVAFPVALSAEWLRALAGFSGADRPTGEINPSALGLIDWLLHAVGSTESGLAGLLYAIYAAALLAWSVPVLLQVRASKPTTEQVMIVILLWLLLSPRVMVYSYLMAIPPCLYVIQHRIASLPGRAGAVCLVLAQGIVRLLPGRAPEFLAPVSFITVLGAWLLFARGEHGPLKSTAVRGDPA
jgi:glycosyl transferase family 87